MVYYRDDRVFGMDNPTVLCVYCTFTETRDGPLPAFLCSVGHTAQPRVRPIRHWGEENTLNH